MPAEVRSIHPELREANLWALRTLRERFPDQFEQITVEAMVIAEHVRPALGEPDRAAEAQEMVLDVAGEIGWSGHRSAHELAVRLSGADPANVPRYPEEIRDHFKQTRLDPRRAEAMLTLRGASLDTLLREAGDIIQAAGLPGGEATLDEVRLVAAELLRGTHSGNDPVTNAADLARTLVGDGARPETSPPETITPPPPVREDPQSALQAAQITEVFAHLAGPDMTDRRWTSPEALHEPVAAVIARGDAADGMSFVQRQAHDQAAFILGGLTTEARFAVEDEATAIVEAVAVAAAAGEQDADLRVHAWAMNSDIVAATIVRAGRGAALPVAESLFNMMAFTKAQTNLLVHGSENPHSPAGSPAPPPVPHMVHGFWSQVVDARETLAGLPEERRATALAKAGRMLRHRGLPRIDDGATGPGAAAWRQITEGLRLLTAERLVGSGRTEARRFASELADDLRPVFSGAAPAPSGEHGEVTVPWSKSTYSGDDCVEVAVCRPC